MQKSDNMIIFTELFIRINMQEFDRLIQIMKTLRSENGCDWDREQTHESIKPCLIEETYEVADAIIKKDRKNLKEELGDLLLQIIFLSRLSEEEGAFSIEDVVKGINEKLIRRHPHVFGESSAKGSKEILKQWEKIKSEEKRERKDKSVLDGIPKSMPPISKAYKLMDKAARVGFEYHNVMDAYAKIEEETAELKEAYLENDLPHAEEELGDLLMVIIDFARYIKIDPETALHKTNEKFIRRFSYVERKAKEAGKELTEMTLEEMDAFWNLCKREEREKI